MPMFGNAPGCEQRFAGNEAEINILKHWNNNLNIRTSGQQILHTVVDTAEVVVGGGNIGISEYCAQQNGQKYNMSDFHVDEIITENEDEQNGGLVAGSIGQRMKSFVLVLRTQTAGE